MKSLLAASFAGLLAFSNHVPAASALRLTVAAGDTDRRESIVAFDVPVIARDWRGLTDVTGKLVPFQVDAQGRGWFVLPELKRGATANFRLGPAAAAWPEGVTVKADGALLRLAVAGQLVAAYQTTPSEVPPGVPPHYRHGAYLHPVHTPAGRLVTADYPSDHRHQRGIFFAWTKTEFEGRHPDFWNMGKDKSGVVTAAVEFDQVDRTWNGPVHGGFVSRHKFLDLANAKPKPALREQWDIRVFRARARGGKAWLFDMVSTQECAGNSPFKLPKYHYGGLGVRGAAEWDPENVPKFITSNGDDRKKGDSSKANWVHFGGPLSGGAAGIAVLIHPDNFRSPQALRLNPNNPQICVAPSQDGDWEISPGKPYVSRYRFVIADGEPDKAELQRLWHDYANPPKVTVQAE